MEKLIETRDKVKEYIKVLNDDIALKEECNFKVEELIERVLVYINKKELPETLYRTLAKAYVEQEELIKAYKEAEHGEVASVSDNGQSISYKSKKESISIENIKENILNNMQSILDQYRSKIRVVGEENANFK